MAKTNVFQEELALNLKLLELRMTRQSRGLVEGLESGWLPQGARIVDPQSPDEGRTFVFSAEEAKSLVEPLMAIARARLEVARKSAAAEVDKRSKTPAPSGN